MTSVALETSKIISSKDATNPLLYHRKFNSKFLDEFGDFIEDDLEPATGELYDLKEKNRKHIQKLIYTNLIDRFDYAIDKTLLELIYEPELRDSLLKDMKEPVTDQKLFALLLKTPEELRATLNDTLKAELRNTVLRKRHSAKLSNLCKILVPLLNLNKPRVNETNGKINNTRRVHKQIPISILGYADWLYCRRNAVVHGGGNSELSTQDFEHLKNTFRVQPAKTLKLSVGSIKNAATYYKSLIEHIQQANR